MASRAVPGWRRGVSKRSNVLVPAVFVAGIAVCAGRARSGRAPPGDLVQVGRGVDPWCGIPGRSFVPATRGEETVRQSRARFWIEDEIEARSPTGR